METKNPQPPQFEYPSENEGESIWRSRPVKLSIVAVLSVLLLIPSFMIKSMMEERQDLANEAVSETNGTYSGEQTLYGPVLSIPYNNNNRLDSIYTQILPENLFVNGELTTQTLNRSIYEVVVYKSYIEISGNFIIPENILKSKDYYNLERAQIHIGISDLRGIKDQLFFSTGDNKYKMESGIRNCDLFSSGANTTIKINPDSSRLDFKLAFNLNGSVSLNFVPFGETTVVDMKSNCKNPSFCGAFLPEKRVVNDSGFVSNWKVLNLNRNYTQMIESGRENIGIQESVFGVNVLVPVCHYQKSIRSVKYAILIILLTFVTVFFTEIWLKKNINPLQYLLIGLALCIFYSLLISLSEHIGFNFAYITATLMTTIMITCYTGAIIKQWKMAIVIGGLLMLLYLYILVLISLETYALLAGSIGLFVILALIMYVSQKVNNAK